MNLPSKWIEKAVQEFQKLPGIGRKSALRLTLHLLKQPQENANALGEAIRSLRSETQFCKICFNISDAEICAVCSNPRRDHSLVCVVEDLRDWISIEQTEQYDGVYHILGGVINPMEGIGPNELHITPLIERVKAGKISEIIMALNPTLPGDTTVFYISKKLKEYPVKITMLSRGVSFGGELEYVDEVTLARSLSNRMPFEKYLTQPE